MVSDLSPKPWGCFNRPPFPDTQTVLYIDPITGKPMRVVWAFKGSRVCNYTLTEIGRADTRCTGCAWRAP